MDIATVVVVLCAVVSTGVALRRAAADSSSRPSDPVASTPVANWQQVAQGGRLIGDPHAAVVITEFADFECPGCKLVAPTLLALVNRNRPFVALSVRHYPLGYHASAKPTAVASECAGEQGRFAEFYEAIYLSTPPLASIRLDSVAKAVGIPDTEAFNRCVASAATSDRIERDIAVGRSLKINGTPTLMINGSLLSHIPSTEALDSVVKAAMQRQKKPR